MRVEHEKVKVKKMIEKAMSNQEEKGGQHRLEIRWSVDSPQSRHQHHENPNGLREITRKTSYPPKTI
jgi:hypothetical protein